MRVGYLIEMYFTVKLLNLDRLLKSSTLNKKIVDFILEDFSSMLVDFKKFTMFKVRCC